MSDHENLFDDEESSIVPSVESQLAQARKLVSAGSNSAALPIVIEALRQDKNNVSALWMYANLIRSDNPDKAITTLKRLLAIEPDHAKAKALLDKLDDDDLFNLDEPAPRRAAKSTSGVPEGINIVVNTQNVAQAGGYVPMAAVEQRNGTAFVAGLIAGWVFGLFGIAHLFNGKIGAGLGYIVLSFLWWGLASGITVASAGICLLGIIPLHLFMVWRNARDGSAQLVQPMMGGMTARM